MSNLGHIAARATAAKIIDVLVNNIEKDREKEMLKLIDLMEKYMSGEKLDIDYGKVKDMTCNKDCALNQYLNRLLDELDPNVVKTTVLNFGFEAMLHGTKTIRKMRTVHNCNIPWLILMDPTSACNLHCTGCWAAEYGNKLNLSYEELSNVVKQGKEIGVYFYMFTGGEPLVRKKDIIQLCEEHHECQFLAFTNGTLVDEAFCQEMKRVGNLALAISLEVLLTVGFVRNQSEVFVR